MIIRKMTACFGCLENETLELREGLNVITAPNESGKSTWCGFIRAMLYGIDSSQREKGGVKPDKLKFAPWSGAAMGGEMEISHEGRDITLRRSSRGAAAPMRDFSAVYTGTAESVPGLTGADAGAILTGMPRTVFESSVFVRQASLAVGNSAELEKRINAIISTGEEDAVSYSDADARLRSWLRKRRHNRSGAIPAIEGEIEEKRSCIAAGAGAVRERAELEEQLRAAMDAEARSEAQLALRSAEKRRELTERVEAARREAAAAEAEILRAGDEEARRRAETETGIFAGMSAEKAWERAEGDAQLLERLRARAPGFVPVYLLAAAAVICFAAGAILSLPVFFFPGIAAAVAAAVVLAVGNGRRREAARFASAMAQRYNTADRDGIMAAAERHAGACAALDRAVEEREGAERAAGAARTRLREAEAMLLQGSDGPGETEAVRRARGETELARRRLATLDGRIQAMGDPMVIKTELNRLEARREELSGQYEALSMAIETLREANDELQQRFSPALGRRAGELMSRLTGGKYRSLSFSRELDAAAKRQGDAVAREKAYLSAGTVDQLYLALRLAICELALPEDRACPLVLDDVLVNFDDERMGLALELLRETARSRQVILFSCHDREERYLREHPGE